MMQTARGSGLQTHSQKIGNLMPSMRLRRSGAIWKCLFSQGRLGVRPLVAFDDGNSRETMSCSTCPRL